MSKLHAVGYIVFLVKHFINSIHVHDIFEKPIRKNLVNFPLPYLYKMLQKIKFTYKSNFTIPVSICTYILKLTILDILAQPVVASQHQVLSNICTIVRLPTIKTSNVQSQHACQSNILTIQILFAKVLFGPHYIFPSLYISVKNFSVFYLNRNCVYVCTSLNCKLCTRK